MVSSGLCFKHFHGSTRIAVTWQWAPVQDDVKFMTRHLFGWADLCGKNCGSKCFGTLKPLWRSWTLRVFHTPVARSTVRLEDLKSRKAAAICETVIWKLLHGNANVIWMQKIVVLIRYVCVCVCVRSYKYVIEGGGKKFYFISGVGLATQKRQTWTVWTVPKFAPKLL